VDDHNLKGTRVFVEDGVMAEDLYNVDEKGIQQGGGRWIRNRK
jgi:hypothetical protein